MTIYEVVHREPYEPGWTYGAFLNKEVAMQYADALVRCDNCPICWCRDDKELEEAIPNIGSYCPYYKSDQKLGYCANELGDKKEYISLQTIHIIEDEVFDYGVIHEKMSKLGR